MGTDERSKDLNNLYKKLRWWTDKQGTSHLPHKRVIARIKELVDEINKIEKKENT